MMKNRSFEGGNSEEITIISSGVKLEGKITTSGSIRVDGVIQGDINSQSNVTVGENGEVNGQINAGVITIGGKVIGSVNAKEKLVLEAKGHLKGDIITKILVVEAGAKFDGKSNMGDSKESYSSAKETVKSQAAAS
jgi:cytoskeletal protein CcmA (bactofilin family)